MVHSYLSLFYEMVVSLEHFVEIIHGGTVGPVIIVPFLGKHVQEIVPGEGHLGIRELGQDDDAVPLKL